MPGSELPCMQGCDCRASESSSHKISFKNRVAPRRGLGNRTHILTTQKYNILPQSTTSGSDASIATSLATAVVAHLAAALGAVSTALDAV